MKSVVIQLTILAWTEFDSSPLPLQGSCHVVLFGWEMLYVCIINVSTTVSISTQYYHRNIECTGACRASSPVVIGSELIVVLQIYRLRTAPAHMNGTTELYF